MTQHIIEFVARDQTGITAVVTATGVLDAAAVIRNIEAGHSCYYVAPSSWRRTPVRTLSALGGAFLFANWDGSKRNNLHDLAFRVPARTLPRPKPVESRFLGTLSAAFGALLGRPGRPGRSA